MYIQNAIYKAVPTGSLSFPITEGSIVTAGGVTGIVDQNLAAAGPTAQIYVAVGGTIDLRSEANKGVSFTDEQVKALGIDFNFIPAKEIADPVKEIPPYSVADAGKVLTVKDDGSGLELATPSGGAPLLLTVDGADVTVDVSADGLTIVITGVATGADDFITAVGIDLVRGGIVYGPIEYDSIESAYVMRVGEQYYSEIIGNDGLLYSIVSYIDSDQVCHYAVASWDLSDPE